MSLRDHWLRTLLLGAAIGCSSGCLAEQQVTGEIARDGQAFRWARGDIGESDGTFAPDILLEGGRDSEPPPGLELASSPVSATTNPAQVVADAEEMTASPPPEPAQKTLAVSPSTIDTHSDAPPVASQMARGIMVERDEPVLSGNIPLKLGMGLGTILLSSALDKPGEHFGRRHGDHGISKSIAKLGNALPLVVLGAAGLAALDTEDERLSRTGIASLQAGGGAVLSSLGLKYVIGRSRPVAGGGPSDFHPLSSRNSNSSMPSIHTAAAWGAVTPFAKEYDMPWLYGVAALTNYARVAQRKHWVSDTVAGSMLGYLAGDVAWNWNRARAGVGTQVYVSPTGIGLQWPLR